MSWLFYSVTIKKKTDDSKPMKSENPLYERLVNDKGLSYKPEAENLDPVSGVAKWVRDVLSL